MNFKKLLIIIGLLFLIFPLSSAFAASWNLPGVQIISRTQRGADEAFRYAKQSAIETREWLKQKNQEELDELAQNDLDTFFDRKRQEYEGMMANDYLITNYASEQIVNEVRYKYLGNYLKRPESIHSNKIKIIIHHTAGDYSAILTGGKEAAIKEIQNIYKYHAINRGWGDIGYNFLIDPFGNIYEGRAGGEGIVGAHASRNNTPSLGISLMGNFNIQKPTQAQLQSLIKLTTALAKKYGIDPNGRATYFKTDPEPPYIKEYPNYTIVGHQDAGVTSCPGINLYSLLPDIREKVRKGLLNYTLVSSSIDKGDFYDIFNPATKTGTQISGFYYSNKTTSTFYLQTTTKYPVVNCSSADDTFRVVSCQNEAGKVKVTLNKLKMASGLKSIIIKSTGGQKTVSFILMRHDDMAVITDSIKDNYFMYSTLVSKDTNSINKITKKISVDDVKKYIKSNIKVLLHDLSMNYSRWEISCDGTCQIYSDNQIYTSKGSIIESSDGFLYLTLGEEITNPSSLIIKSSVGGLVTVTNYNRNSYAKIPRNTFRGSLIFIKDQIKNLQTSQYENKYIIINELPFNDYLKGIGETSESDNMEKIKLMSLLAKTYALFYMDLKNKHPSIPDEAKYSAIDSPDMFQKYVGAGAEKTFVKYQTALSQTKKRFLFYSGYVPILPYFSCSAGFTLSAQEKWGWSDTPYLQSRVDMKKCADFAGHGVGLSGKGAQYLASNGRTYKAILNYYYPGVVITTF